MRAIIVGAGAAGSNLAERLNAEKCDVVVVDHNPSLLSRLTEDLDILTIEGNGSSPVVLEKAGVRETQILVAVTDSDEVNILACAIARAAGVPHCVARVSSPDYVSGDISFDLKKVGVDLALNPKEECANELSHMLEISGTQEVIDLFNGRVLAVGFKVSPDSPLTRCTLGTCPKPDLIRSVRFIALQRGEDVIIPHGDTGFMVGDELYVVGRPADLDRMMDYVYPDRPVIRKVVIAGGGVLGRALARRLEKTRLDVTLIEQKETIAEACTGVLDRTLVLHGNVTSGETLEEAGITEKTAFVSVTGSDENNIIGCLLGQRAGACLTIAKVSKPEYVPIINSLSLLDRAVNPHLSMMNAILHFVRGHHVRSAALMSTMHGELLEVMVGAGHEWCGKQIKDLQIPRGAIIAVLERIGEMKVPAGDVRIESGDRLMLFALEKAMGQIKPLLERNA